MSTEPTSILLVWYSAKAAALDMGGADSGSLFLKPCSLVLAMFYALLPELNAADEMTLRLLR